MGDFIQIGPDSAATFDVVMNDSRFVNIQGNSESMFFDADVQKRYEAEAEHQAYVKEQLGAARMARLRELPLQKEVAIGGKTFFMVHARVGGVADTPLLYQQKPLEAFLADYSTDADCVLIGHTHLPLYAVHWSGKPVINPGAIGCGKDGVARFAIAEIENGQVNVAFKQIPYDKEQVVTALREKNVPCGEKFIRMFF